MSKEDLTDIQKANLDLCNKYPILVPRLWVTGEVSETWEYENTILDDIPEGWRIAFGEQWAKDVQEAINKAPKSDKEKIYVLVLKEKFGEFRQHFSYYTDDLTNVIRKYEQLSRRTCVKCGKPATRYSTGWVSPWCDECTSEVKEKYIPIKEFLKRWEKRI